MKTILVAATVVLVMMFIPGLAMAQQLACPGGGQPIVVQPQPQIQQYIPQPQVSQPPIVVQAPSQNTTDPVLLKILLGIQAQMNNLQNQLLILKQAPALPVLPPPSNTTTPLPPPPPPDNGQQQGSSCPNQQQQQPQGSSCPNSGGQQGPGYMPFYQGPGFQGFQHFGGHHSGGHNGGGSHF